MDMTIELVSWALLSCYTDNHSLLELNMSEVDHVDEVWELCITPTPDIGNHQKIDRHCNNVVGCVETYDRGRHCGLYGPVEVLANDRGKVLPTTETCYNLPLSLIGYLGQ